jgi:hypothetical protein
VELEPELDVAYTKAVAISVDPPYVCGEMRSGLNAHFPFLSDQARRWQKELDLQEYTDPTHDPFLPTTFLLEPGLIIYKIYTGYWFWGRPTKEDLRQDFRAISQKCRPDWDAQAPGVREAWEEARAYKRRLTGVEFSRLIQEKREHAAAGAISASTSVSSGPAT